MNTVNQMVELMCPATVVLLSYTTQQACKCCSGERERLFNWLGSLERDIIPTLWFECEAINIIFVIMLYQLLSLLFFCP
jgi:hypothetical protein